MAQVYTGADLVILAALAKDGNDGCLLLRPDINQLTRKGPNGTTYRICGAAPTTGPLYELIMAGYKAQNVQDFPLFSRG
jgi:hypothetical protein